MIALLSKSDDSAGFDQIVDFLNAQVIHYALMVNLTIYASCIKQFWATSSIKKVNDVVKLQALVDRKKTFVELARMGYEKPPPKLTFYKAFFSAQWKFLIHTLNQCMSAKRTAWNEFSCSMASTIIYLTTVLINNQVDDLSSHTTKYTSPALTQKVFANMRRIGKLFSGVETSLFATMLVQPQVAAEEEDEEDEVPAAPTPPSPIHELSPPPNEPITSPPQAQPTPPSSPPQSQPTTTSTSDLTLLNTLMETCTTLSHKVTALEQDKVAQALKIIKLKQKGGCIQTGGGRRIKTIDVDEDITLRRIKRKDDDNVAAKEVNATEPTVFDDKQVTMTMAQTLIKIKVEKARILDEQMAKRLHDEEVEQMQEKYLNNIRKYQRLKRKPISVPQAWKNMIVYLKNMTGYKIAHFKGMIYDQVRPIFEREYNKVQTFLKPDRDEEPIKKRVAKETLLQESIKKLIAEVEVLGSRTYWKIIRVGRITQAYQSFKDMLKDFNREDLDALWRLTKEKFSTLMPTEDKEKALWVDLKRLYKPNATNVFWKVSSTRIHDIFMFLEKDYHLTDVILLIMLSTKLQVDEDYEMAMDLVMKIFMEANKPKRKRSLDTSSN
nr:hypothetical protein [Tanacetum cinerariifolium]